VTVIKIDEDLANADWLKRRSDVALSLPPGTDVDQYLKDNGMGDLPIMHNPHGDPLKPVTSVPVPVVTPASEAIKAARAVALRERLAERMVARKGERALILKEIAQLRKYRQHKRDPRRFKAVYLPQEIADVALSGDFRRANRMVGIHLYKRDREASVGRLRDSLKSALIDLAMSHKGRKAASHDAFKAAVQAKIASAYSDAYTAGRQDYDPDYTTPTPDTGQDIIDARVAAAAVFLVTWADNLPTESDAATEQTAGNFANGVNPAYDNGTLDALTDANGDDGVTITWMAEGDKPCDNCSALDGQSFSPDELPGFPGDGDFGQDTLCTGGPNCNCGLDYSGPTGTSYFGSNS